MEQHGGTGFPAAGLDALDWRCGSASAPGGEAIEVAVLPSGDVAVRSSLDPASPALVYTRAEITAFILGVKDGEFDDLVGELPGDLRVDHPE